MSGSRWLRSIAGHETVLLVVIGILLVIAEKLVPGFTSLSTQAYFARQAWEVAILAVMMTAIIITGGIDLSVGSTMGLAAVTFGMVQQATGSLLIASIACLLAGTVCGLLNGCLIAGARVHPLIITLATFAAYRGVAEGLSQGRPFSGFGSAFTQVARATYLGMTIPAWTFLILVLGASVILAATRWGRYLYALGLNERAARFSGTPVARLKCAIYTLSGLGAGLAGLLYVARFDSAQADVGKGFELDVITAVVVGGASIYGGRGNLVGTTLGLVLIHETRLLVTRYWRMEELKPIAVGSLLIISLLIYQISARWTQRS
ncbi:MAG: ABC transporter permease [Planctomycetales bacterium]|nr:ABC transporter permease [Planctomycetales bacterium]